MFGGARRDSLDDSLWRDSCEGLLWLSSMDATRRERLRELSTRFLREKTISPIGELTLDDRDRVRLAALCCLPLLEFGAEGLHGWSELIVYPEAFRVHREDVDDDEVQHEWEDELIGEAWEAGPLILSWTDVLADIASPWKGLCLPVHEMAHKLDALDGEMDGTPPLPREWQRAWARDFEREYAVFAAAVDRDEDTAIDPYAAESPEEFFAVCSEYHFAAPRLLRETLPAVAEHLRKFYGESPAPPCDHDADLKAPAATPR
ncbi:MAG: zinc-dependent peptidase [Xanthomonadaceae bacterium]|nr:zinc-dependent peptidase [Xanthomonadaceae bacterium]